MTAQRLVRGGKARIFLGIAGVLIAIIAIFHHENVVSEYEIVKKRFETCTQQSESLSVNLQVIVDYKNKLEKSLQQEKLEHKQTRTELEARVNDEKLQRDKTSLEANLRFTSLQQHYKLLQAKHDDLKVKTDKQQQENMEEIDQLHSKVKELEETIKQAERDKGKSLEHLKTEFLRVQGEKESLEQRIRDRNNKERNWESEINHLTKLNHQLQRELNAVKNENEDQNVNPDILKVAGPTKNFAKQMEMPNSVYQIQDQDDKPIEPVQLKSENSVPQIEASKLNNSKGENANNQDNNVLPPPSNKSKSTTKSSSLAALDNAKPIIIPTVTPETKKEEEIKEEQEETDVLQSPELPKQLKIPKGVVPIPNETPEKIPPSKDKPEDKNIPEEINLALPNRYRNNIIEEGMKNEILKETKDDKLKMIPQREPELNQDPNPDNNAMEVIDQPKVGGQDNGVETIQESNDIKVQENEPNVPAVSGEKRKHIDDLGDKPNAPIGAQYQDDYKDVHKDDLQVDEGIAQQEADDGEEDDVVDDYGDNLAARQKEPAVRN